VCVVSVLCKSVYQELHVINSCVRVYKLLCVCMCRGRGKVSLKEVIFLSMVGRECRGYTLFPMLQLGKRVLGTFSNFHRTGGGKECSTLSFPVCMVGQKSGQVDSNVHR